VSDLIRLVTLGFISAISRTILAIATLGLVDEDDEDEKPIEPSAPSGGFGRIMVPAQRGPQRREPSRVMRMCMLAMGADLSGLSASPGSLLG